MTLDHPRPWDGPAMSRDVPPSGEERVGNDSWHLPSLTPMSPHPGLIAVAACALCLLAPAPARAGTVLVDESFRDAVVTGPYKVGGTALAGGDPPCLTAAGNSAGSVIDSCPPDQEDLPAGGDPAGDGALRLTDHAFDRSGFVLYQEALPLDAGLDVSFDFFQYDGHLQQGFQHIGIPRGADGIAFFLSDGDVATEHPGALGGGAGLCAEDRS
jgi:hypothetical protein